MSARDYFVAVLLKLREGDSPGTKVLSRVRSAPGSAYNSSASNPSAPASAKSDRIGKSEEAQGSLFPDHIRRDRRHLTVGNRDTRLSCRQSFCLQLSVFDSGNCRHHVDCHCLRLLEGGIVGPVSWNRGRGGDVCLRSPADPRRVLCPWHTYANGWRVDGVRVDIVKSKGLPDIIGLAKASVGDPLPER